MSIEPRHHTRLIIAIGVGLCVVAAFLPWVEAHAATDDYTFAPASTKYIRGAVLLELIALITGLALFVKRRTVALVGAAGAIWFNVAMLIWLAGYRVATLIPSDLLPEDAAAQLGLGASIGAAGGILVMLGSVLVLLEQTWGWRPATQAWWVVPSAIVVSVLALASRDVPWIKVSTRQGFNWNLSFDVVPLVGDLLSLSLVAASVAVVVLASWPRRFMMWIVAAIGACVAMLGVVGFLSRSLVTDLSDWIVGRAAFLDRLDPQVDATNAPLMVFAVGLVISGAGFMLGWNSPASTTGSARPVRPDAPADAPLPPSSSTAGSGPPF